MFQFHRYLFVPDCLGNAPSLFVKRRQAIRKRPLIDGPGCNHRVTAHHIYQIILSSGYFFKFVVKVLCAYRPSMAEQALQTYQGNCHCGAFKFVVKLPVLKQVVACNCSICSKVFVTFHLINFYSCFSPFPPHGWRTRINGALILTVDRHSGKATSGLSLRRMICLR